MAPTLSPEALTTFHARAQRYVRAKGWRGAEAEDLVSTMVLGVLEHPEMPRALAYVYLHACDTLHPRTQVAGQRSRSRTVSLEAPLDGAPDAAALLETLPAPAPPEPDPWAPAHLARLLRRLPPRDAWLLRAYYLEGQREQALATARGVTISRISQLLHQAEQRLIYTLHLERRRYGSRRARVSRV